MQFYRIPHESNKIHGQKNMERNFRLNYNHNPNVGFLHYMETNTGNGNGEESRIDDPNNAHVGYFRHSPMMPSSFLTSLMTDSQIKYPGVVIRNIKILEECYSNSDTELSIDNDEYDIVENGDEQKKSESWEVIEAKRKDDSKEDVDVFIDAG